jgi:hypothetical protein
VEPTTVDVGEAMSPVERHPVQVRHGEYAPHDPGLRQGRARMAR